MLKTEWLSEGDVQLRRRQPLKELLHVFFAAVENQRAFG